MASIAANNVGINNKVLEKLSIAEYNPKKTRIRHEILEDPKWLNYPVVYPPHEEFLDFYDIMIEHMKRVWTCVETNIASDVSKFVHAPEDLKYIVGNIIGLFILGDTVVLDNLKHLDLTPNVVRMFLDNQTDRENTHQLTYSMWADILDDAEYVRSEAFIRENLKMFKAVSEKYKHHEDNRVVLFFIMVCEMIFFVPGFQVLCYLATTGYAPNLCNANMLVMRDEHMHYMFARKALSTFECKLDKSLALSILNDMVGAIEAFITPIATRANHKILTLDHFIKHLHYVVHQFKCENLLYDSVEEELIGETTHGTTPAWSYLHMLKYETKINLMESLSTNYKIPGPLNHNDSENIIDMAFDDDEI